MADAKSSASPVSTRKSPAFQFYASDFLASTFSFTYEQRGVHVALLCLAWDKGPLPTDLARLAQMLRLPPAKFRAVWAMIGSEWTETASGFVNLAQERTRAEQRAHSERQAERGRAGMRKRWGKEPPAITAVMPDYNGAVIPGDNLAAVIPGDNSPSSIDQDQEHVHPPRSGVHSDLDLSEEPAEHAAGAASFRVRRKQNADHRRRLTIAFTAFHGTTLETPYSELAEVLKQAFAKAKEPPYDSGVIARTIDAWRAIRWPESVAQPATRGGY